MCDVEEFDFTVKTKVEQYYGFRYLCCPRCGSESDPEESEDEVTCNCGAIYTWSNSIVYNAMVIDEVKD